MNTLKIYYTGIAVILAAMLFYSCSNDLDKVREPLEQERKPTAITRNVIMIYSDSGEVLTEVRAPVRYDYATEPSYSEMPEGVTAVFYSNGKKSQITLTAGYAMIKNNEDLFYVQDSVRIVNEKGETLETETLICDNKRQVVFTYELIKIKKRDKILYGEGIIAPVDFNTYTILIPQGTLSINE